MKIGVNKTVRPGLPCRGSIRREEEEEEEEEECKRKERERAVSGRHVHNGRSWAQGRVAAETRHGDARKTDLLDR